MVEAGRDDAPRPLDLRRLELAPGEARELEVQIQPGDILVGGQRYVVEPPDLPSRIEVAQSASGWHLRLRTRAEVAGPCWRCLSQARIAVDVDARDFAAFGRDPDAPYDEDLDCEYLDGDALDVTGMARDAIIDRLPSPILCRDDCAGLCPTCGGDLNAGPCGCPPPPTDSRWEALKDLAERLRP
jgi:uncharacterized protein